jgi:hypothetical protein
MFSLTSYAKVEIVNGNCSFENELPDWIPSDFESAVEFNRAYGATHIEDGFVCCIHKMYGGESCYKEFISGYSRDKASIPYLNNTYEASEENCDFSYNVKIFKPDPTDDFHMLWTRLENGEIDPFDNCCYEFKTDKDGNITEIDDFGWLPDCVTEAKKYKEENGVVSTHGFYVVFCDIGNYGTGYTFNTSTEGLYPIYDDNYEFSDPQIVPLDGGEYAKVTTYDGDGHGTVTMTFTKGRDFEPEEKHEKIVKHFRFDGDLDVTEINEDELDPVLLGDSNYDEKFDVADIVLLQQYLIGRFNIRNAANSDVNEDGTIDVFDLIKMRKMLLSGPDAPIRYTFDENGPILISLYDNFTSLDCIHYQRITIYAGNGKSYSLNYKTMARYDKTNLYDELFSFSDYNWYGALSDLMNNENAEVKESALKPEVFEKTKEMSANLNNYLNDKENISKSISIDRGSETLFLIGADDTGKPEAYSIFTSGDVASIKKNETVQDYVKFLFHNTKLIDANCLMPLIGDDFFYE